MNDIFPAMVYKGVGMYSRPGGTYDFACAMSPEELSALLADGWKATLVDAIEAHDNPKADQPAAIEQSGPTRAELEQKATELGIAFDGRTTDAKLMQRIEDKLKD